MPRYVVGKKSIIHGGTVLKEGDPIELTEDQAEQFGLEQKKKEPEKEPKKK